MFLSKMSLLDSVEHDPKKLSMLVYFGMDAISKSLISEHLQEKKKNPNLLSYFCNQCLPIAFHESISLLIYF